MTNFQRIAIEAYSVCRRVAAVRSRPFVGLAMAALLFGGSINAVQATPVAELTALLQSMQSATGEFEQTLQDARGKALQSSQGTFAVKKPGKFLWHTHSPFPQQLISDGKMLWLYDADLEQATLSVINDKISQTPAVLLSGDSEKIAAKFTVSQSDLPAGSIKGQKRYQLTSKAANADFSRIQAEFNGGVLAAMSFEDKAGNTTQFRFNNVDINAQIADAQFDFAPPPGTDIIRNEQ